MITVNNTIDRIFIEKIVLKFVDELFHTLVRAACNRTFGVEGDYDKIEVDSQVNKWKSVEFVCGLDGVSDVVETIGERAGIPNSKRLSRIASKTCKRFTPSARDCSWRWDKIINDAFFNHATRRAKRDFELALASVKRENSADVPTVP